MARFDFDAGDELLWAGDDGCVRFIVTNWDDVGEGTVSGDIVSSTHPHHPEGAFFTCAASETVSAQ